MSKRIDGSFRCDYADCDADVMNGSIHYAVVVTDMHPFKVGEHRQLHWGRACGHATQALNSETIGGWITAWDEGAAP